MKNLKPRLKDVVRDARKMIMSNGIMWNEEQIHEGILFILWKYKITIHARNTFDSGIPQEEGPVWFDSEEWKTDFWKHQWELQKAYREGERARMEFTDRKNNPYSRRKNVSELKLAWDIGFDGLTHII